MENTIVLIPIFTVLFLPIIYGMEKLFKWLPDHYYWQTKWKMYSQYLNAEEYFKSDDLIQGKSIFLNEDFF